MASPKPVFEETLFSPKRRDPMTHPHAPPTPDPPRPPVKAGTPKSRVFARDRHGPAIVTADSTQTGAMSPFYNAAVDAPYFEQCFENLGELGKGSFGVVYKARSRDTGTIYAIKKSTRRYQGARDRLRRIAEVKAAGTIANNPHCLHYYGGWEENDVLYLQTEYCENGSLRDYAYKIEAVPEAQAWQFLADAALGLKAIHDRHLLHLDIKPANLFLDDEFRLKIGDFGIAAAEDGGDREEGDPVYMAPELLADAFGRPADVFSLGVSLLDVICGRELPGSGPGWQALRSGSIPRELLAGVSPEFAALLQRMLALDPAARPTADELLQHPRVARVLARRSLAARALAVPRAVMALLLFLWGWLVALVSRLWFLVTRRGTTTASGGGAGSSKLPRGASGEGRVTPVAGVGVPAPLAPMSAAGRFSPAGPSSRPTPRAGLAGRRRSETPPSPPSPPPPVITGLRAPDSPLSTPTPARPTTGTLRRRFDAAAAAAASSLGGDPDAPPPPLNFASSFQPQNLMERLLDAKGSRRA